MIILSKKIFKYIMLVSSMVTVLGLAFVIGILSHSFQRQLMNELKKEAVFISDAADGLSGRQKGDNPDLGGIGTLYCNDLKRL